MSARCAGTQLYSPGFPPHDTGQTSVSSVNLQERQLCIKGLSDLKKFKEHLPYQRPLVPLGCEADTSATLLLHHETLLSLTVGDRTAARDDPSPPGRLGHGHSQGDTKPAEAADLSSPGGKEPGGTVSHPLWDGSACQGATGSQVFNHRRILATLLYVLKGKACGQLRLVWCNCRLVVTKLSYKVLPRLLQANHGGGRLPFSSVL